MLARFLSFLTALFAVIGSTGCDSGRSTVSGKVTAGGKDVTAGNLVFAPADKGGKMEAGAPVTAAVGADGKYSAEGVQPGKILVTYVVPSDSYPEGYKPKPSEPPPPSPFKNLVVKETTIEIKAGANPKDIELIPSGKK